MKLTYAPPEMINYLQEICEDPTLSSVRQWRADNPAAPVVGYLPAYAPRELIYAAGGLAVGLWGGGAAVEIVQGDAYYQSYICHLPRSVIDLAMMGVYQDFAGLIFPSICDVVRNLSGMWKLLFPSQWAFYLDLPQNFDSRIGGKFYREQLVQLATLILGKTPDPEFQEKLRQALALTNRQSELLRLLQTLRSSFPHKIPFADYYYLLRSALILPPEENIRLINQYLDEADQRDVKPQDNIRVVLAGAFCEQPTVGLLRTIEKAGCYIVNHDLLLGLHWFTSPCREDGDPFESLVEGFLHRTRPAPFKFQGQLDRGQELVRLVQDARADGVIFASPSFCDPALLERPLLAKSLQQAGIPFTSFKYAENMCQYQGIKEMAGTFSDSIRLWGE